MRLRIMVGVLLIVVCASSAFAQGRFEFQPFVGYKFGGSTPVGSNGLDIAKLTFNSSIDYGLTAGFNATPHFGVEFMWNRQPTHAVAALNVGGNFSRTAPVNIDQYHANFLYTFRDGEEKLRPFVLVGFGATSIGANGSSETKYSFGVGGGVKYFFSTHMGVRLQARYTPSYLYSTNAGVWCGWYGFCFAVPDNHYLSQGDVTAGWILRF